MSRPSFPDGNGIRHVMLSNPDTVTGTGGGPRYVVSMCGLGFSVAISEIDNNMPADCMTCLVHQARMPG